MRLSARQSIALLATHQGASGNELARTRALSRIAKDETRHAALAWKVTDGAGPIRYS